MSNGVTDIDRGYEEVREQIDELTDEEPDLTVGVHAKDNSRQASAGGASSINQAYLLAIHMFGWGVPQRDPVRPVVDKHDDKYLRMAIKGLIGFIDGQFATIEQALAFAGLEMVGDIKDRFGDSPPLKPNAPATIARKGSSAPLIDTGQLKQSIDYVVGTS